MEDSETNVASTIKNAYETLERTRGMINDYREINNLELATEQLAVIETNLNQIPKEHRCWNSRNCLGDIKRQKGLINTLKGMLYSTN